MRIHVSTLDHSSVHTTNWQSAAIYYSYWSAMAYTTAGNFYTSLAQLHEHELWVAINCKNDSDKMTCLYHVQVY